MTKQEVLDYLDNVLHPIVSPDNWNVYSELHDMIEELPSAEPMRHGKWIFNPSDAFEAMFAKPKCSECGFESADGLNYCPNCGARMDEE